MADQRTMVEFFHAPTEDYAEEIVVPPILDEQFELKSSLINMLTSDQFFGLEKDNPHDHIHLLRACPHHGFTELYQLDTFYNALNPADQDSLISAAGNLLKRRTQDVLTIIESKSKVRNSRNKSIVSQVKLSDGNSSSSSEISKLTQAVNQQTSAVTTAMTVILVSLTFSEAGVLHVNWICFGHYVSRRVGESSPNPTTSNLKRRNRRRLKQPFILEESLVDTMADQRTMVEFFHAPTEDYAEEIVVPPILDEQFELKSSLINMLTSDQFFGLEKDNPHDHIHLLRACPHHGFTELYQLDTFYNALNPADQDSLISAAGNLLKRRTQDVLTIIESKSKVRNSRNKSIVSQVKLSDGNSSSSSEISKLTQAVNQQTSAVTTAMTVILVSLTFSEAGVLHANWICFGHYVSRRGHLC
nr:reverse transcriptase domain-containing protein [Tanacetum cinerariifolium]